MMQKIRAAVVLMTFGILAGIGAYHLRMSDILNFRNPTVNITVPKDGVQSDAFSLRLFQQQVTDYHPAMVAPASMGELLLQLAECSTGTHREDIEKLNIRPIQVQHHAVPEIGILIAADLSLPYVNDTEEFPILRLPFRENYPQAISLFNTTLSQLSNSTLRAADSETLTPDTNLAAGLSTSFSMTPDYPFYLRDNKDTLFYFADGSARMIPMMRQRADLRYARAEDGTWEAVAILLKPNHPDGGEPVAFIAIKPREKAANFARSLTVEQLSHIRQSLAETMPRDCSLAIPVVNASLTRNWIPQLNALGLQNLTNPSSRNWGFTTRRLGLDVLAECSSVHLAQSGNGASPVNIDNAAHSITFDTPYIWLVGDLTGASPPYLMGIYQ